MKSSLIPAASALFAICGLLLATTGCGEGVSKPSHIPDLTACVITVTYNGQLVADASVLLAPQAGEFSASGLTDQEGKAVMKTDGMYEGVVPGEYIVSVTKREILELDIGETPQDPADYAAYEEKLRNQPMPKHLIPEKYSSFTRSGLTLTISEGTPTETTLELTD